jgi:hypothetical protein
MRSRFGKKAELLFVVTLLAVAMASFAFALDKKSNDNQSSDKKSIKGKTYKGTVGDALCGIEHSMPVSAIECIRQCIGKGSRYSLIVGDKVYALDTDNQAFLDLLDKQATAHVEVTGTESADGKIILVNSVKALP